MKSSNRSAIVIGAGFAGLAGACLLARNGWNVTIIDRNGQPGGRARVWESCGYRFDMGPSWYLMPEVFEHFFQSLGEERKNYYELVRLDPAYRIYFEDEEAIDIPADPKEVRQLFARFQTNGDKILDQFLQDARYKYETAMQHFLYRDYNKIGTLSDVSLFLKALRLKGFRSMNSHIQSCFKDHRLQKILLYAMVFLGSSPENTPAIYSLMSHVDLSLGVWFPKGGMGSVVEGFVSLTRKLGVRMLMNQEVRHIVTRNNIAEGIKCTSNISTAIPGENDANKPENLIFHKADVILNTADYHWSETQLLAPEQQSYSSRYWSRRIVAPSMLLAYLGINRKIPELAHHNLYFSRDWNAHFHTIFHQPGWPENPCWYISNVGQTTSSMSPEGKENIFLLVPLAPNLEDTEKQREKYFQETLQHVKKHTGLNLSDSLEIKRIFSHQDFISNYNSFQGSALGLSHSLFQTAMFRPRRRNRKIPNLYYAGQYTHPGVGVPMVIISSHLAAKAIGPPGKNHP